MLIRFLGGQAFAIKLRKTLERSTSSLLLEPPFNYTGYGGEAGERPRWRQMKYGSSCAFFVLSDFFLDMPTERTQVRPGAATGRFFKLLQAESTRVHDWTLHGHLGRRKLLSSFNPTSKLTSLIQLRNCSQAQSFSRRLLRQGASWSMERPWGLP